MSTTTTTTTTAPKHQMTRKEMRQPDEFITTTGVVLDWAQKNRGLVQAIVAGVVLLSIGGGALRWWLQARQERSARDFYAADQLFQRKQWQAAGEGFSKLASELGGTAYGKLAVLYAAHSALRAGNAAEAAKGYRDYLDAGPASDTLAESARVNLARALAASGDKAGAKTAFEQVAAVAGAYQQEAILALARLEAEAGNPPRAIELYQQYLKDAADAPLAEVARFEIERLGGTPPPRGQLPAGMASPLQVLQQ